MKKQDLYRHLLSEYYSPMSENVLDRIKEKAKFKAVPIIKKKNYKRMWQVGSGVAACMIVGILTFMLFPYLSNRNNEIPSLFSKGGESSEMTQEDIAEISGWVERSISSKYDTLYMDEQRFNSTQNKIIKDQVGKFICNTTLIGYDYTDPTYYLDIKNAKEYKIDAEVYTVKSVSSKCLMAVKYNGQDDFYSFIRTDYEPETLGDFIQDLNLRETLVIKNVNYDVIKNGKIVTMEYKIPDVKVFWDMLNSNKSAKYKNSHELGKFSGEMNIIVSMDIASQNDKNFSISKDGYLYTNLYDTPKAFYIGEKTTKAFMEYILTSNECSD